MRLELIQQVFFWALMGLVFYAYFGFPLILLVRGFLQRRAVDKADIYPQVSLVIVAHNEVKAIGDKLANVLSLDYPRDKYEVIVASDGSDDGTNEIVASFAESNVRLLAFPRLGKIPALNAAATKSNGDILIFSDANSMYAVDAIRVLVRSFADPRVGAVGGNQCYISDSGTVTAGFGERLYWSLDRSLKSMQSEAGSMISATGAIHAIRRKLFQPVPLGVGDDFVISTRAISQGYRLVFEPDAVAFETLAPTEQAEFQRKVRVIVRGLRGLWAVRELFNPLHYGFYSIQIFSHKLLRWSVGWLLIILFFASLTLYNFSIIYRLAVQGQIVFYGVALGAFLLRRTSLARSRAFKFLTIPFYFCLANFAAVRAWLQLLGGRQIDLWDSNRNELEVKDVSSLQ